MPLVPNFIAGAYQARSINLANEALINLYVETTQIASEAKKSALIGTPGLKPLVAASDVGCRGSFSQDGTTWTVIGSTLYEVTVGSPALTSRGTIANDGNPVTFASNGRGGEQLGICGGGHIYMLHLLTHVLTDVALPFSHPVVIGFFDGYFHALEQDSPTIWFSALEDGLIWDALDFYTRSHVSDNLVGFVITGGKLWGFGSATSEVFYDTGDVDTPFAPYPGSILPWGLVSPWAVAVYGLTIGWLAQSGQSDRTVMHVTFGEAPSRLSTPAIDRALSAAASLSTAEAFTYAQAGHAFLGFTIPSTGETWCVDLVEPSKPWHQRMGFSNGSLVRWSARGICATGGTILAGDYATGQLYTLDLDTYTDNGQPRKWLRRAPYLSAENQWLFIEAIELGVESGVGLNTGQGSDPQLMLRISKDSGHTYGAIVTASIGAEGAFTARAIWRRLGRVRSDRLGIEVSQTDPVKPIWGPGLWLRATAGTGQL